MSGPMEWSVDRRHVVGLQEQIGLDDFDYVVEVQLQQMPCGSVSIACEI